MFKGRGKKDDPKQWEDWRSGKLQKLKRKLKPSSLCIQHFVSIWFLQTFLWYLKDQRWKLGKFKHLNPTSFSHRSLAVILRFLKDKLAGYLFPDSFVTKTWANFIRTLSSSIPCFSSTSLPRGLISRRDSLLLNNVRCASWMLIFTPASPEVKTLGEGGEGGREGGRKQGQGFCSCNLTFNFDHSSLFPYPNRKHPTTPQRFAWVFDSGKTKEIESLDLVAKL